MLEEFITKLAFEDELNKIAVWSKIKNISKFRRAGKVTLENVAKRSGGNWQRIGKTTREESIRSVGPVLNKGTKKRVTEVGKGVAKPPVAKPVVAKKPYNKPTVEAPPKTKSYKKVLGYGAAGLGGVGIGAYGARKYNNKRAY